MSDGEYQYYEFQAIDRFFSATSDRDLQRNLPEQRLRRLGTPALPRPRASGHPDEPVALQ